MVRVDISRVFVNPGIQFRYVDSPLHSGICADSEIFTNLMTQPTKPSLVIHHYKVTLLMLQWSLQ